MTPEEVTAALKAASDAFPTITGRPADENIIKIVRIISAILRQVDDYDEVKAIHNLEGVVLTATSYRR